jgi:hypothetical protein
MPKRNYRDIEFKKDLATNETQTFIIPGFHVNIHKYIYILLLSNLALNVCAQQKDTSKLNINALFNDLPIDDPAENSILKEFEDPQKKIQKNIFVTATASKTECYIGEPILLSYKLYSSLQSTSTISKLPSLFGFNLTELDANNENPVQKKIKGKTYREFTVEQYQLISFQEGKLDISPLSLENVVSYADGSQTKRQYSGLVNSNELNISVKPLPAKDQPPFFSGAVGKCKITDSIEFSTVGTGGNNILHIEIAGTGNFAALPLPEITWPGNFEHFTVREQISASSKNFPAEGKKIFDIPFISKKAGHFIIPALQMAYFDASKTNYRVIECAPIAINVLEEQLKPTGTQQHEIIRKSRTIRFYLWALFIVAAISIPALIFVFHRKKKKSEIVKSDELVPLIEPEIISTDYNSELENIEKISRPEEYITEFKKLLICYFQEKTGRGDGTEEELLVSIKQKDASLAKAVEELLYRCNSLLYANVSPDSMARALLKNEFLSLLEKGKIVWG